MIKIAITCGDINGIGPEIAIKTILELSGNNDLHFSLICPGNLPGLNKLNNSNQEIISMGNHRITPGLITAKSGRVSFESLETACKLLKQKNADVLVTAPITKEAWKKAGINFPGHTEYLADFFHSEKHLMLFYAREKFYALSTIHIPIKKVSESLSKEFLISKLETAIETLIKDFGIVNPTIAVLGLNPHAGENGNIGNEEINIITPAIEHFRNASVKVEGPFVPDAFFAKRKDNNYNLVLGMYHDQALIPFKMLYGEIGVNYTAGLPVIRTSPDHGTAFDIAGKNIASPKSMIEAVKLAIKIHKVRNR